MVRDWLGATAPDHGNVRPHSVTRRVEESNPYLSAPRGSSPIADHSAAPSVEEGTRFELADPLGRTG